MQGITIFLQKVKIKKLCQLLKYSTICKNEIVFMAAVRTPIASFQEKATSLTKLAAISTDMVIKQAALPKQDIDELYLVNISQDELLNELIFGAKSKNIQFRYDFDNSMNALLTAVQKLQENQDKSLILTTGMESSAIKKSIDDKNEVTIYSKFQSDIVPVTVRQRHEPKLLKIAKDELPYNGNVHSGTISIAMTNSEKATQLGISPLARIIDIVQFENKDLNQEITGALARHNLKLHDISKWELSTETLSHSMQSLHFDTVKVNRFNLINILTTLNISDKFMWQLNYLLHTMTSRELGCIITSVDNSSNTLILVEKLPLRCGVPTLTLYTKNPCPLCDKLVNELEESFHGEFRLEKIFIDQKENIRFLRLYRYDIPVLFLNGQFLCMHSLNKELLRYKLDLINSKNY